MTEKEQENLILTWYSQAVVQSSGFIVDHTWKWSEEQIPDTLSLETDSVGLS